MSKQRELYWDRKKDDSEKKYSANRLTDDRISRLESAGFLWRGANAHSKYPRGQEDRPENTSSSTNTTTTDVATVIQEAELQLHEAGEIQSFL